MTTKTEYYYPKMADIVKAGRTVQEVVESTPVLKNMNLSVKYDANIRLKREDLQMVRSYKIRGAYNKIAGLSKVQLEKGIVCASAGNHAQGVAYSCKKLGCSGVIYMPETTPRQKIKQVKMFGGENVEVILIGDTFDDASNQALADAEEHGKTFIHPFDDPKIIEGQGTIGLEILQDCPDPIDYIIVPIGGGGLASGLGAWIKEFSPQTKIIGVEPEGAPSMKTAFEKKENVSLVSIDRFVDGAAVQKVGDLTWRICEKVLDDVVVIPEGLICSTILRLYNEDAIVAEPAGALSIAALELISDQIKGKNVVCILSGSNNDITRMEEIKERSLLYEGLKHYFIVRFPQRSGALKEFVNDVLDQGDDITHFEYYKKHSREKGPAVIGIEVRQPEDLKRLQERMTERNFVFEYLNDKTDLFQFIV
ncbi:threonine ammonia-lyase IlvA [Marinifilum fragile]|uniref:threonine ammonia-lyase IlvA n=1 Tax=Marinifilum fragile TaxID=570161 RepID=UPI001C483667|nr:threonine ammonia-lyase IlvA [Marinifilum fragile]